MTESYKSQIQLNRLQFSLVQTIMVTMSLTPYNIYDSSRRGGLCSGGRASTQKVGGSIPGSFNFPSKRYMSDSFCISVCDICSYV